MTPKKHRAKSKDWRYDLFKEAMDEWNKVMTLSLEALNPFQAHSGNCSTICPSCRLKDYYWKIRGLGTEIEVPGK